MNSLAFRLINIIDQIYIIHERYHALPESEITERLLQCYTVIT